MLVPAASAELLAGGWKVYAVGCPRHRFQARLNRQTPCASQNGLPADAAQQPQVIRPRRPTLVLPEPTAEQQEAMARRSQQTKAEALQRQRLLSAQRDRRRPSVTRAPPPSFRHTLQGEPAQALDQPQVRSKPAARRKRVVRQAAVQPVPTPPEELKAKQLLLEPEHVPGMGSFAKKVAKHKVSRENWRDAIPLHPSSVAATSSGVDEQRQEAIRKWHEWKEAVAKDQERFDRPEEQSDPEVEDDETTWADRSELLLDQRPDADDD